MIAAGFDVAALGMAALAVVPVRPEASAVAARWREVLPRSVVLPLAGAVVLAAVNGAFLWSSLHEIEAALGRDTRAWVAVETLQELDAATSRLALLSPHTDQGARAESKAIRAQMQALSSRLDAMALSDDAGAALRIARVRESIAPMLRAGDVPQAALADSRAAHAAIADVGASMGAETQRHMPATTTLVQRIVGVAVAGGVLSLVLMGMLARQSVRNLRRVRMAEDQMHAAYDTLDHKVAARTAQLSRLSRHLLNLAETEKSVLASELHDELGSNLTAINLDIAFVAMRLAEREPALAARLQRTAHLLHETVDIKRRIVQELRPSLIDNLGLCAAVEMHCEDFVRLAGISCRAECSDEFPDIDPAWAIALFRVAQEALSNVSKYAQAHAVTVSLQAERDGIRLRVIDDGIGIEPGAADHPLAHGLLGMHERMAQLHGQLDIRRGAQDRGTVVDAYIPVPAR